MGDQKHLSVVLLTSHRLLQSMELGTKEHLKIQARGLSLQSLWRCFKYQNLQFFAASSEECAIDNTEYWLHTVLSLFPPPLYSTDASRSLSSWDAWVHTCYQHQGLHYSLGNQGEKAEMTVKVEKWWYKLIKVHFLTLEAQ